MAKIAFANPARDAGRISAFDSKVISDCAENAGVSVVTITSTARTPEEQAHAMYVNCKVNGPKSQKALYGLYGDLVIQVYIDQTAKGITAEATVVAAMALMIRHIGAERVSHHCVTDWSKTHVIDISASQIEQSKHAAFEAAIVADSRIARHFSPYTVGHEDPAFHIEVPQMKVA
jgi:hypothetical protein